MGRLYKTVKRDPIKNLKQMWFGDWELDWDEIRRVKFTRRKGDHITAEVIGKHFGVSEKTVRNAEKFAETVEALQEISPQAAERVLRGEVRDALTKLPEVPKEALSFVAKELEEGARSIKQILREWKREQLLAQEEPTLPSFIDIRVGDFREVLNDLEGQVDAIITDPPYPKEYISLYGDLAELASRLLKPHGVLVVMAAHIYLPEYFPLMCQHLQFRWIGVYLMEGPKANVSVGKVATGWKPLLFFVRKDASDVRFLCDDVFRVDDLEGVQKDYHDWGQSVSGFMKIVERLTEPGELVVDPFVGSGTTAIACVRLQRRFVGCDIDPQAVAIARRRVANIGG
jgi:16S rRNA G966 N2-methylase RsmD